MINELRGHSDWCGRFIYCVIHPCKNIFKILFSNIFIILYMVTKAPIAVCLLLDILSDDS